METLGIFIACVTTGIVSQILIYHRSASGEMDVSWNEEDCMWDVNLHMPAGIDYSRKKKLILKINQK